MPRWERMKEAWKGVDDGGRLDTSPKKQKRSRADLGSLGRRCHATYMNVELRSETYLDGEQCVQRIRRLCCKWARWTSKTRVAHPCPGRSSIQNTQMMDTAHPAFCSTSKDLRLTPIPRKHSEPWTHLLIPNTSLPTPPTKQPNYRNRKFPIPIDSRRLEENYSPTH